MRISIFLFLSFVSLQLTASVGDSLQCFVQDPKARTRDHQLDMQHMLLDLEFDVSGGTVFGDVTYTFSPLRQQVDTLFLDAPAVNIKSADLNGNPVTFDTDEKGVTFRFDESLEWEEGYRLKITYDCRPRKGIYFIGWNDPKNLSRKQIWTQGQGIDNRHWIPSYDNQNDKLITELKITFDAKYRVISNGNLMSSERTKKGQKTWHYKMTHPHSVYLVMLAIGEYDFRDIRAENGIISRQYYYPDEADKFNTTYAYSREMMDWMERELGVPYPWETYANVPVQDFMYGAMENTTATIFTDYYVQDERGNLERPYIGTNAHELAHQWFGDYVTEWSATHHWLHESYATHLAKHFRRSVEGEDEYQWIRRQELERTWAASKKNNMPIAHSRAGGARHYPKGSLVIDMLRTVVGEDQYKKALKAFLEANAYDLVDTHEFLQAFMETLGMNLDWFFEQWLYRGGEPHYKVSQNIEGNELELHIEQIHERSETVGLFSMPINFDLCFTDGTKSRERKWVRKAEETMKFEIPSGKNLEFVLFDPNWEVIKMLTHHKTFAELSAQSIKAENMIDRFDAVRAMRELELDEKRIALLRVFDNEKFHASRAEVVRQLVNDDNARSKSLIRSVVNDPDSKVRRALIEHVDSIKPDMKSTYVSLLNDRSYVTIEKTLRKLCKQYPDDCGQFLTETKQEMGMNKNVRITWLEMNEKYASGGTNSELIDYSSNSYEFRTRISAFEALERLDYLDEELIKNLIDASLNPNGRLMRPALKVIRKYVENEDHKVLMRTTFENAELEDWQKEIIENQMKKIFNVEADS